MRSDKYQIALIVSSVVVTGLLSVFVYRELFPEYKKYQNAYVKLEDFRSEVTGKPVIPYQKKIRQVVMQKTPGSPPEIDRCVSCHVALDLPHFGSKRIARDVNGYIKYDEQGIPLKEQNPNDVWYLLDKEVQELKNEKTNKKLFLDGKQSEVNQRASRANKLESWKKVKVGDHTYDMTKVLSMHPLIGAETKPFEFHPVEEFGCSICHNGNGRGLTTERAHGPVYDEDYEGADMGVVEHFQEVDSKNDPEFSRVFNEKPGHKLLFQTTPLFVGAMVESKCIQCHQTTQEQVQKITQAYEHLQNEQQSKLNLLKQSIVNDKHALATLFEIRFNIETIGLEKTLLGLEKQLNSYSLTEKEKKEFLSRRKYLSDLMVQAQNTEVDQKEWVLNSLRDEMLSIVGSRTKLEQLDQQMKRDERSSREVIEDYFKQHSKKQKEIGQLIPLSLVEKEEVAEKEEKQSRRLDYYLQEVKNSLSSNKKNFTGSFDKMLNEYQMGKGLFLSQACYACHMIEGFSRGQVGPDLTQIGLSYPWYIKESIVWPQADLSSSVMPNFEFDHEEIESLMTYLMAQRGSKKDISEVEGHISLTEWKEGKPMPWETPLTPVEARDLNTGYVVFATQGCASCHLLKGYESQVGLSKRFSDDVAEREKQKAAFMELFPKGLSGKEIADIVEERPEEIDRLISVDSEPRILDRLDKEYPETIEAYYPNFKVADRARNHIYEKRICKSRNPEEKRTFENTWKDYQDRVRRVLFTYIGVYGLGREIAPNLHWAGVYNSEKWLMDHFVNPQALIPRSIMPAFPFDRSKFAALTHFLQVLSKKNRDEVRQKWEVTGFNPEAAYEMFCASCHGDSRLGDGPVAKWIYPIPKNLRNATFLRNLTRERAIQSIVNGVEGTPMSAWSRVDGEKKGNNPVITPDEAAQIVDWLFSNLPGSESGRESAVNKWNYKADDVVSELATDPAFEVDQRPLSLEKVFDLKEMSKWSFESEGYYFKKKYYTQENILSGEKVFMEHCAHCHGESGAGDGKRSIKMYEAKPRMLINLSWLNIRDDLGLLKSIKYGVPGTSMISFADVTSPVQRLQLTVFIRSLSEEKALKEALFSSINEVFNPSFKEVNQLRYEFDLLAAKQADKVERLKEHYFNAYEQSERSRWYDQLNDQQLWLNRLEERDVALVKIKEALFDLRQIWTGLVNSYVAQSPPSDIMDEFKKAMGQLKSPLELKASHFKVTDHGSEQHFKRVIELFEERKAELKLQKLHLSGHLQSNKKREEIERLRTIDVSCTKLLSLLQSSLREEDHKIEELKQLVAKYVKESFDR